MKPLRHLAAVVCALGFFLGAHAQSVAEVKASRDYVWGEGVGETAEEAERIALAQMSRSISVSVFNASSEKDDNGSHMQKSIVRLVSSARLQNVQVWVLSEEPDARVFCFIHKDEVQRMFKLREQRISDLIETGKTAESRLQVDDALRCYYWALLLAKSNPEPVSVAWGGQRGPADELLKLKIKSVLQLLQAEIQEGTSDGNSANARISFHYDGKPVSSVQFTYHDGQSIVGPIKAKDGIGEVDLVSVPADGKLRLAYETRFKKEVDPLDADLLGAYTAGALPVIDAAAEIPMKLKKGEVMAGKAGKPVPAVDAVFAAEPVNEKKPIEMRNVSDPRVLQEAVLEVERAIGERKPEIARQRFTPDGYRMFSLLFEKCGTVTLSGTSSYEFIEADGYLLGRATRLKIKFRNGTAFMENLVYRFNPSTRKIESIAFALTKRGENDIMNAAASWPEVSRWAILSFMEDYQTAFALKRLDYISSIFAEDAIIITGALLKKKENPDRRFDSNRLLDFGHDHNVKYSRHTKEEYIRRLKHIFDSKEFAHLTFENNVTKIIDLPSVVERGAAFGIEIKQRYVSPGYSDEGYLTLAFDTRGEHPIIHVRLWQPDQTGMVSLQEFISKFSN